jgi:hypothetical protein
MHSNSSLYSIVVRKEVTIAVYKRLRLGLGSGKKGNGMTVTLVNVA